MFPELVKDKSSIVQPCNTEKLKQFLCGFHSHTDILTPDFDRNGLYSRHGVTPKNLARYIVNSGLDFFAITEHIQTVQGNIRNSFRRFQEVCEEVDRLKGGRKIVGKYGVELSMTAKSLRKKTYDTLCKYHINVIFKDKFTEQTLPDLSDLHHSADISKLQEFQNSGNYPHISILNHPSTENFSYGIKGCNEITKEIMMMVNGVEIANRRALSKKEIPVELFIQDIELAFEVKQDKPELALIGSGDIHAGESECVSTFSTIVYAEDINGIFDAVRKGLTKIDIGQSPQEIVNERVVYIYSKIKKLIKAGIIKAEEGKKIEDFCNINSKYLTIG